MPTAERNGGISWLAWLDLVRGKGRAGIKAFPLLSSVLYSQICKTFRTRTDGLRSGGCCPKSVPMPAAQQEGAVRAVSPGCKWETEEGLDKACGGGTASLNVEA